MEPQAPIGSPRDPRNRAPACLDPFAAHGAARSLEAGLKGRAHRQALAAVIIPECQDCGVCCFSLRPEHVRVWEIDRERMGEQLVERYTQLVDGIRYMGMSRGCCDALEVDPVHRRFACGIYEVRPDTCRGLQRGSSGCRDEIVQKRDRPMALLAKMGR